MTAIASHKRARSLYRRDVHYIVREDKVCIVDESTGRIFEERSWRDGLHQAIEVIENVPITAEHRPLARITRQRFYRRYKHLAGMTGTAQGSEGEFQLFYNLPVTPIATRLPSQRAVLNTRFFTTADAKWLAIAKETHQRHQVGQPVLIGTRSIARSEILAVMSRASTKNGEITADLNRSVRKAQQQVERQHFLQRRQLFYQDRHRDTVMAKLMGVQS